MDRAMSDLAAPGLMAPSFSVVAPSYNEAEALAALHEGARPVRWGPPFRT